MKLDLTGKRFGKLVAIKVDGRIYGSQARWLCECDCGRRHHVARGCLIAGKTRSCGCARDSVEVGIRRTRHLIKHGMARHPVYSNWRGIMKRCFTVTHDSYSKYGALGIVPCQSIKSGPEQLLRVLGPRPTKDHSVDRIDGSHGYNCGECEECVRLGLKANIRWATKKEQSRNTRSNRLVTIDGITKCVIEWACGDERMAGTIYQRLSHGWTGRRLIEPPDRGRHISETKLKRRINKNTV